MIIFRYFQDFEKKIPRKEIEEIEKILKEEINDLDDKYLITICGSYRRGKRESGDIDVLLTHPNFTSSIKDSKKKHTQFLKSVVQCLEKVKLITDTISLGETKFMVIEKVKKTEIYIFIKNINLSILRLISC